MPFLSENGLLVDPSPTFIGDDVPAQRPYFPRTPRLQVVDSIPEPECVNVTMDGAVLCIPVDDLVSPSKARWWFQHPPVPSGGKTEAMAKAAWLRYAAYTGKPKSVYYRKTLAYLHKSGFQFWLRCKLQQWGLI